MSPLALDSIERENPGTLTPFGPLALGGLSGAQGHFSLSTVDRECSLGQQSKREEVPQEPPTNSQVTGKPLTVGPSRTRVLVHPTVKACHGCWGDPKVGEQELENLYSHKFYVH